MATTKKVKMQVAIAGHVDADNGHDHDFSYMPGEEVEIDAGLADKWASVGHCTIIGEGSKVKPSKKEKPEPEKTNEQAPSSGAPADSAQASQPPAPPAADSKPPKAPKEKKPKASKKNSAGQ